MKTDRPLGSIWRSLGKPFGSCDAPSGNKVAAAASPPTSPRHKQPSGAGSLAPWSRAASAYSAAAMSEGDNSLYLDDSDVEERTSDGRYTRTVARDGPVYSLTVGPITWECHDAYDEEEAVECHWDKVTVHENVREAGEGGSSGGDGAVGAAPEGSEGSPSAPAGGPCTSGAAVVLQDLKDWKALNHPLLLNILKVWQSHPSCVDVVTLAPGVHNLRKYLELHQKIGEPAIRKIARQVIKAMIALQKLPGCPVWAITSEDIHIKAGSGRIQIIPAFIWRSQTLPLEGMRAAHLRAPITQARVLRAWVAVVLELYLGRPMDGAAADALQEATASDVVHPAARSVLTTCLDEAQAATMPMGELLEDRWLDTRQSYHDDFVRSATQRKTVAARLAAAAQQHPPRSTRSIVHFAEAAGAERESGTAQSELSNAMSGAGGRFSAVDTDVPGAGDVMQEILDEAQDEDRATFTLGSLVGVDYSIEASGTMDASSETIMFTVRLQRLASLGGLSPAEGEPGYKVLTFPYDIRHDTVDSVAREMQEQFGMSDTDKDLVESAMCEVMAQQLPGLESLQSVHEASMLESLARASLDQPRP